MAGGAAQRAGWSTRRHRNQRSQLDAHFQMPSLRGTWGCDGTGGAQVIVESPNSPTPHADSELACLGQDSRIAGIAAAFSVRPYSMVRSQMSLLRFQFP